MESGGFIALPYLPEKKTRCVSALIITVETGIEPFKVALRYYFCRPHSATAGKPPAARLGFGGNNGVRNKNCRHFVKLFLLIRNEINEITVRPELVEGLWLLCFDKLSTNGVKDKAGLINKITGVVCIPEQIARGSPEL